MSIWHGVNRKTFEAKVKELHAIGGSHCPVTTVNRGASNNDKDSSEATRLYTLPSEVEKQICDDFAFLAAAQSSAYCVAGATLQEAVIAEGATIVLAANAGISDRVTEALREVCKLLESCAHCSKSKEECASQCLDISLSLHGDRIRDRLGLNKGSNSNWRSWHNAISVSCRLDEMVREASKPGTGVAQSALLLEIANLKQNIDHLGDGPRNNPKATRDVVEAAARISKRDKALPQKLVEAGFPAEYAQRNEIRRIKNLANYYHCCKYLCDAARTYRTIFRSITLKSIPPYPAEKWPVQSRNRHYVHAEIQLLVHHELNSDLNRPRYIGVSKRACFLCYSFMRGYAVYITPETHGQVHPQWTVPDLKDYSESSRRRLRDALRRTKADVELAMTEAGQTKARQGLQIQSPAHSYAASLKTASASTIRPTSRNDSMLHVDENLLHGKGVKVCRSLSETSLTSSESDIVSRNESFHRISELSEQDSKTGMMIPSISSILKFDWLTLFLPLDGGANTSHTSTEDSGESNTANQCVWQAKQIAEPSICSSAQVIKVADLGIGETLKLNGMTTCELDVVFVDAGRQPIGIHLSRNQAI